MRAEGYYVMNRNQDIVAYESTQEAAVDWACTTAPAKPPRGFGYEIWRNDGVRVAVVTYNPQAVARLLETR